MKITVVGKVRRTGVSKSSGKPYDFIEVHFVSPARGIIGEAAQTMTMDASVFPFDQIVPGVYSVDFDNKGTPLALVPVQQSVSK